MDEEEDKLKAQLHSGFLQVSWLLYLLLFNVSTWAPSLQMHNKVGVDTALLVFAAKVLRVGRHTTVVYQTLGSHKALTDVVLIPDNVGKKRKKKERKTRFRGEFVMAAATALKQAATTNPR